MIYPQRGFALIVAVIFSSVVLAVGLALLDITYKQVLLSGTAKNSQYAFYNADSGLECALYWDQKDPLGKSAFDYTSPRASGSIGCENNIAVINYGTALTNINGVSVRKTTFNLACPGGYSAHVEVFKDFNNNTDIYAEGYNYCESTNPARIERGIKIHY